MSRYEKVDMTCDERHPIDCAECKNYEEPAFPYPEVEDEYYDDYGINRCHNPKWDEEYPLIIQHNIEYVQWLDRCDEQGG
jgi:hypothetical protein